MSRIIALIVLVSTLVILALGAGAVAGGVTAVWLQRHATVSVPPPTVGATIARLAAAPPGDEDEAVVAAVRATRPAVVTIWNLQRVREGYDVKLAPVSSGSGVVFDPRGYIATNTHVLEGAEAVQVVFLDGHRATAQLVNFDPGLDVAILKVEPRLVGAVAPLADSALLEPGMRVLAIGSPLGTDYQNTVTQGIIAGLNRRVKQPRFDWSTFAYREEDVVGAPLIQTDAAINTGNSGGPLVSLRGEVVGLNTLIVRSNGGRSVEGLGFAIPSNVVRALAEEWIDGRSRGTLGIEFDTLDPLSALQSNLTRATGALVTAVQANSTAAQAGIAPGDVITAIDGTQLDLDRALADLLWRYRAGDTVQLNLERDGQAHTVTVVLDAGRTAGR